MNNSITPAAAAFVAALLLLAAPLGAAEQEGGQDPKLARAVSQVPYSLERGIAASSRDGTPISAKYELEDGKLQLSVYTMRGDKFSEVIVDHKTGKIAKVEPVTGGGDLTAAQSQKAAMGGAKRSLGSAVAAAVKTQAGYRAVSAMPEVNDGHPSVRVMLLKSNDWKTVHEKLD